LDVSFGDNYSDHVSVILGEDDAGDSFSIKLREERVRKTGPQLQRNKISSTGVFVRRDGQTPHYFEIRFLDLRSPERLRCVLYVSLRTVDTERDTPVFTRDFPPQALGTDITRIRLKLWQAGRAEISDFEVAELPLAPRKYERGR
jgi:hypothetical protein